MALKYNNLSAGYIGETHSNATWNSQYFDLFLEKINTSPENLSRTMIFPQRISRAGFFEELYSLETDYFKTKFNQIKSNILGHHQKALKNLISDDSEKTSRCYINWSNILLRYGCFEEILSSPPTNNIHHNALEMRLIIATTKIETLLSTGNSININELLELSEIFIDDENTSIHAKIKLLNQIIVNFYRHQQTALNRNKISKLTALFLKLTKELENNSFVNMLYCSVAYRGLAMASELGIRVQVSLLKKAEELARNLPWNTQIEKIIAHDNLFTCLQTMSKWCLRDKDATDSENYMLEMIQVDPFDSTGHSEIGFFYFNTESYNYAANYFLKAMELGPPGAGMNAYFYAKCLEKQGKEQDAITYLQKATLLDSQAISPWLDLMSHFINQKQFAKIKKIANHIYQSPTLYEQLDDDEKSTIQNYI